MFANAKKMEELAKHPEARWVEGASGMKYLSVPANAIDTNIEPLRHPTDPSFKHFHSVLVIPEVGGTTAIKAPYDE